METHPHASKLIVEEDQNRRPFVAVPLHQAETVHREFLDRAIGHTLDPVNSHHDTRVIRIGILWDRGMIQDLLDQLGSVMSGREA